ncbi:MAG: Fic family protein [Deltaproteobacteria bacterium]|jgi:Fic family protein|nr:Fic family protein [Deltaproteobacteria bacterium]
MPRYFWETPSWPNYSWNQDALIQPLALVRELQERLLRAMADLGLDGGLEACAMAVEEEAIHTSAIEGERLSREKLRSSIARFLGLPDAGLPHTERAVEGLVEVLLDASHNHAKPLTKERLWGWHAALFPYGRSGLNSVTTGTWRTGTMRVVSGPYGYEKVHYEAPPPERIEKEMEAFLSWWDGTRDRLDGIVRAALAHLYFVTIHPFDDGNGRLARALADMALAQDDGSSNRFYSLSSQVMKERAEYYDMLKSTQWSGECTQWLAWFIGCLGRSLNAAEFKLDIVSTKAAFWWLHRDQAVNGRQKRVIDRLLDLGRDGFIGGLTVRKYMGMTKASNAIAVQEIGELVQRRMLRLLPGTRSRKAYEIEWERGNGPRKSLT